MPSPVAELFRDLGGVFGRLGLRWYVFGAQAALLHGAARLTADVDVTVDAGASTPEALAADLARAGFDCRTDDLPRFVARTRVVPVVHRATRIPVDIVLAGPGPEELFLSRATVRDVEGVRVPVAAPEDLVAMKLLAGRPKDIDDALAVVAANPGFRADVARETLHLLEAALDRSDLVPALDALFRRAR